MKEERKKYGNYVAFTNSIPDADILINLPSAFDKLLKSITDCAEKVGEIDLDTLEIIFKTDKTYFEDPLNVAKNVPNWRASLAVKADVISSAEEDTDES